MTPTERNVPLENVDDDGVVHVCNVPHQWDSQIHMWEGAQCVHRDCDTIVVEDEVAYVLINALDTIALFVESVDINDNDSQAVNALLDRAEQLRADVCNVAHVGVAQGHTVADIASAIFATFENEAR